MSRIMNTIGSAARFAALGAMLFLWTACADGKDPGSPEREPVQFVDVSEPAELEPGDTVRLAATPRSRDGSPLTGRTIVWASEDTTIATVSASGLVTARKAGTVVIFASVEGKLGSSVVVVNEPASAPVYSVEVLPAQVTADASSVIQFSATPLDGNGMPLERAITWRSSNPSIALVDPAGLVLAVAPGTVDIIATSDGKEGHGRLTVQPVRAPVARVEHVTGGVVSLYTGDTHQLGIRAYDAAGTELFDRAVTWTSSNDAIARVSPNGVVEGRTVGNANVIATVEGISAPVSIDVRSRIARISQSPGTLTLAANEQAQVQAVIYDIDGSVLQRRLTWTSSNPAVATVDANGRITAVAAGDATIKASAEGQEGWTYLRVVPWIARQLATVGDSLPPTTLFTKTSIDSNGAVRTTRVTTTGGFFSMALIGTNSGRYEQHFQVWVVVDGQAAMPGQYVYRGDFQYDPFNADFVLTSLSGQTQRMRILPDARVQITGSLEANTPSLTLKYGPPQS